MIEDIAFDLEVKLDGHTELLNWINNLRASHAVTSGDSAPDVMAALHATQAIADIIASNIRKAPLDRFELATNYMINEDGWEFSWHNMTLWLEDNDDYDTIVVWLGNTVDYDMVDIGRSQIK
jgi:hypothetical protein